MCLVRFVVYRLQRALYKLFVDVHIINQSVNQTNYFIVPLKVDQRAGQLSLSHLVIIGTNENIKPMSK